MLTAFGILSLFSSAFQVPFAAKEIESINSMEHVCLIIESNTVRPSRNNKQNEVIILRNGGHMKDTLLVPV